jgi:hypothetical protein
MKRMIPIVLSVLAVSVSAFAQAPAAEIDKALLASPENLRKDATVIKWKADNTYDTLRKGTNRLVCYDQSGAPAQQPFAVECTSITNLERKAQNRKFEVIADRAARTAAIAAAEKDGTRIKPEFGTVWYNFEGADQASARMHMTIATPGATKASLGLPENGKELPGNAWIMNAGTSTAHLMIPGH